jgi:hypothetical protein
MSGREEFHYNQGVAPMMWVLFALSLVELMVVHFFVALKWPYVGWPLTILSAIGALGILFWIRSFKARPHTLEGDRLTLHFGSIKSVALDLANIAEVKRSLEPGALDQKGTLNLAGIAYPNRAIELKEPLARGRNRVFVRLDDPASFDRALEQRGIAVG